MDAREPQDPNSWPQKRHFFASAQNHLGAIGHSFVRQATRPATAAGSAQGHSQGLAVRAVNILAHRPHQRDNPSTSVQPKKNSAHRWHGVLLFVTYSDN